MLYCIVCSCCSVLYVFVLVYCIYVLLYCMYLLYCIMCTCCIVLYVLVVLYCMFVVYCIVCSWCSVVYILVVLYIRVVLYCMFVVYCSVCTCCIVLYVRVVLYCLFVVYCRWCMCGFVVYGWCLADNKTSYDITTTTNYRKIQHKMPDFSWLLFKLRILFGNSSICNCAITVVNIHHYWIYKWFSLMSDSIMLNANNAHKRFITSSSNKPRYTPSIIRWFLWQPLIRGSSKKYISPIMKPQSTRV